MSPVLRSHYRHHLRLNCGCRCDKSCLCRLYNKEAIIQFLLDKDKYSDQAAAVSHIRGLKDVVTLNLTRNKEADTSSKPTTAGTYTDPNAAAFVCPVTDLPMNGHYRFSYLRGCGCVVSDKALREIPSEACHKCGKAYAADEVVVINPSKDEEDEIWAQLVANRKVKAPKKRKAGDDNTAAKLAKADNEIQGSDAYKSLFLTDAKRRQIEQGESFTARAVHRAYIA